MSRAACPPTHRPTTILLLAAVCLAATTAAADIHRPNLEISPSSPTFIDALTFTVSGEIGCLVSSLGYELEGEWLLLNLTSNCHFPAFFTYEHVFEVPPLAPGDYTVLVRDLGSGELPQLSRRLTVFYPGDFDIQVPGPPASDDRSVPLRIRGYGFYCPVVESAELAGDDLIEVRMDLLCPSGPTAREFQPWDVFTVDTEVGPIPAGDYTVRVLADFAGRTLSSREEITVYPAGGCQPSPTTLCLQGGRFRVEVEWRDFADRRGDGIALPLPDREDTGLFWFFRENNVELTVKVLDGCGVNGHYWVFIASGSTVEYEITVSDTEAEGPSRVRTYRNALGQTPALIPDNAAFPHCP